MDAPLAFALELHADNRCQSMHIACHVDKCRDDLLQSIASKALADRLQVCPVRRQHPRFPVGLRTGLLHRGQLQHKVLCHLQPALPAVLLRTEGFFCLHFELKALFLSSSSSCGCVYMHSTCPALKFMLVYGNNPNGDGDVVALLLLKGHWCAVGSRTFPAGLAATAPWYERHHSPNVASNGWMRGSRYAHPLIYFVFFFFFVISRMHSTVHACWRAQFRWRRHPHVPKASSKALACATLKFPCCTNSWRAQTTSHRLCSASHTHTASKLAWFRCASRTASFSSLERCSISLFVCFCVLIFDIECFLEGGRTYQHTLLLL